ncbi:dihydrofolate reductase [Bradyrhizobium sp. WD16]|uniref:dihydrofolate reductase n=1 Tax=Bradyrhizobium sp. WD16 TaxID=1521768 RepID=UPI0020A2B763|nr:dihydrofolate reductase [Bradyrhizobium sp. WD16]UTD28018.1 diacylglycerol kinase [Bradyrhizobium sp. WD16]
MTAAAERYTPAIVFVVAVAQNGVIGRDGTMPWRLKSDLQHFKALTFGKPVVMGRKTFASIGRPLPGRTNIVVTRDPAFQVARVVTAPSLDSAYDIGCGDAWRRGAREIAVIGGADIFAQWMARADRLEITEVHARPEGDTVMPALDTALWLEVGRTDHKAGTDDSCDFSYVSYRRRQPRA